MRAALKRTPGIGFLGLSPPPARGNALPRAEKPPATITSMGDLFPLSPSKKKSRDSTDWHIGSKKNLVFRGTEAEYHYFANLMVHHSAGDDQFLNSMQQLATNASTYELDTVLSFGDRGSSAEVAVAQTRPTVKEEIRLYLDVKENIASFKKCAAHVADHPAAVQGSRFNPNSSNYHMYIPDNQIPLPPGDLSNRVAANGFALQRAEFPRLSDADSLADAALGDMFVVQPHFKHNQASNELRMIGGKDARLRISSTSTKYHEFANLMLTKGDGDVSTLGALRSIASEEKNESPLKTTIVLDNQTALEREGGTKNHKTNIHFNLDDNFGCFLAGLQSAGHQGITTRDNLRRSGGKKPNFSASIAELSEIAFHPERGILTLPNSIQAGVPPRVIEYYPALPSYPMTPSYPVGAGDLPVYDPNATQEGVVTLAASAPHQDTPLIPSPTTQAMPPAETLSTLQSATSRPQTSMSRRANSPSRDGH
jgi:hypothetical protein